MSPSTSTAATPGAQAPAATGKPEGLFTRLYTGTGAFGIIPHRRRFYALAAVIVAVCLASILFRGFTYGIDFTGGTKLTMPADGVDKDRVPAVVEKAIGQDPQNVQIVGSGNSRVVEIETGFLDSAQISSVKQALSAEFEPVTADGRTSVDAIGDSARSESWGGQVTEKALMALGVFLVIIFGYIGIRFEWRMAVAAIAALIYDLITTAGVYSLIGLEVTPATVIGLLTILGFSLYDTVVVFDKVRENTHGLRHTSRRTYAEEANLAVNQTLMRSINTTVIGLLPLISLVVIAVWLLGVGTLKDLALVQMVGIVTGTFSSVFLATPILVSLKERTSGVRRQNTRVAERRATAESAR